MIIFIHSIWNALSNDQRMIVLICLTLILIAISLFLYDRLRKPLYKIPILLYKMRCRQMVLAKDLNISPMEHLNATSLIGISNAEASIKNLADSIKGDLAINIDTDNFDKLIENNIDILKPLFENMVDPIREQMKTEIGIEPATINRIIKYYSKISGLDDLLQRDMHYNKLSIQLDKIRTTLPTEEMATSINDYLKKVRAFSILLTTQNILKGFESLLSLNETMDMEIIPTTMEDELTKALAKVRESIDIYYGRYKNRNGEN